MFCVVGCATVVESVVDKHTATDGDGGFLVCTFYQVFFEMEMASRRDGGGTVFVIGFDEWGEHREGIAGQLGLTSRFFEEFWEISVPVLGFGTRVGHDTTKAAEITFFSKQLHEPWKEEWVGVHSGLIECAFDFDGDHPSFIADFEDVVWHIDTRCAIAFVLSGKSAMKVLDQHGRKSIFQNDATKLPDV
jgi:hypothetical protein